MILLEKTKVVGLEPAHELDEWIDLFPWSKSLLATLLRRTKNDN